MIAILIPLILAFPQWEPGTNLGPNINTAGTEKASDISADGQTLYFSSQTLSGDINIYMSTWTGAEWSTPVDLGPPVNSIHNDWGPSISGDGMTLYFGSDRPGGYGSYDIYSSTNAGGVWQTPVNLGPSINTSEGELGQDIRPDGAVLFFARGWPPQGGSSDENIYWSEYTGGSWTQAQPWEQNTSEIEDNPNISDDGTLLYFSARYTSGGYGDFDIYVSRYENGRWQTPINLGPGINTEHHDANPSVTTDGRQLHYTSKDPSGYGYFDLYVSDKSDEVGEYGSGLAGSGGFVPRLEADTPVIGGAFQLSLLDGLGGAAGRLLASRAADSQPFGGGTLLVDTAQLTHNVPLHLDGTPGAPGAGTETLSTRIPSNPLLYGTEYYLQAILFDGGAVGGYSMTAGTKLILTY